MTSIERRPAEGPARTPNDVVLAVRDLRTEIRSGGRRTPVVRGVSFDVRAGETVALVGESGSGKSLTALSVMGLLPEGIAVTGGSVRLGDRELLTLSERARRSVRGAEIAMIYQDPMTSLNPLMRVGDADRRGPACPWPGPGRGARAHSSRHWTTYAYPGPSAPPVRTPTSCRAANASG